VCICVEGGGGLPAVVQVLVPQVVLVQHAVDGRLAEGAAGGRVGRAQVRLRGVSPLSTPHRVVQRLEVVRPVGGTQVGRQPAQEVLQADRVRVRLPTGRRPPLPNAYSPCDRTRHAGPVAGLSFARTAGLK